MKLNIQRWKSKRMYVDLVELTDKNYWEVAEWAGYNQVILEVNDGLITTIQFINTITGGTLKTTPGVFVVKDLGGGFQTFPKDVMKREWKEIQSKEKK